MTPKRALEISNMVVREYLITPTSPQTCRILLLFCVFSHMSIAHKIRISPPLPPWVESPYDIWNHKRGEPLIVLRS